MLVKLRRDGKGPAEAVSLDAIRPSTTIHHEASPARVSFFTLPAELRNDIYEQVISDATLTLPATLCTATIGQRAREALRRRKPRPSANNINGLLLASKQCRHEYRSILLSTVSVVVEVKDFDFANLIRVSSSLRQDERRSLQANPNLHLHLDTRNCTKRDMASLRRWLEYRANAETQLPWHYEFPLTRRLPPSTMGEVRLVRELEYYADTLSGILFDLPEEQQSELRAVIDAFESKATALEQHLGRLGQRSRSFSRDLRGLAGGGVH